MSKVALFFVAAVFGLTVTAPRRNNLSLTRPTPGTAASIVVNVAAPSDRAGHPVSVNPADTTDPVNIVTPSDRPGRPVIVTP